MRKIHSAALAAVGLIVCLIGCSRDAGLAGEKVIFDAHLALVRGKEHDTVKQEVIAPADGTCVAHFDDDEVALFIDMETDAAGAARAKSVPSKVSVAGDLYGGGTYLAAVPVARGSKVSINVESTPDLKEPGHAYVKVVCYDDAARTPQTIARVEGFQAWSEGTMTGLSASPESLKIRTGHMDVAIARLESPDGDAEKAAWAHWVKGNLLLQANLDVRDGIAEMRLAEKGLSKIKDMDPHQLVSTQFYIATGLIALINEAGSTNPTPEEARAEATRIFTELAKASSPLTVEEKARAVKFLGVICYQSGDFPCANRYFDQAANLAHKAGDLRNEMSAIHNIAATANELGNYAEAVRYFDRVIPLVDKQSFPAQYVTYYQNAAVAYSNYGDTPKAIRHLLLALQAARETGSPQDMGRVMYALGLVYWRRGDTQQAQTFFEESLKQRRLVNDTPGLINSLAMVGRFARLQGRIDEAMVLHRESLSRASTPDMKMRARYELSFDHAQLGQYDRSIALCREVLADGESISPLRRVQTQIALADYLVARSPDAKALDEADELSRAALKFALEKQDTVLEVSARHVQAKVLVARKKLTEARREYENAIALILDFRGTSASPELQAATLAHEQDTFREYVDLLMREVVTQGAGHFVPASQDAEDALRALELARSSSASRTRDVRLDAATQQRIDALLQQMAVKRVRIAALNDHPAGGGKLLDALQIEMSGLRAEVDRLRGADSGLTRSSTLPKSIGRAWPAVAPRITQLSFALGKRNVYLWARDEQGLRVAVLAESPARLEHSLAAFGAINPIRSAARLEQALAELSTMLLPAGTLSPTSGSLEVVAEGRLGTLPFAALREPKTGKRLVEAHAVRMITSMFDGGTQSPAGPRQMAFVGIASNTGELRSAGTVFPGLGAARAEARAIAALFAAGNEPGQVKLLTAADGDAETIRTLWRHGADAVHFATHGLANLQYPSASLLLLPKGGGKEAAYLTAGEVQEWRGDAGLVFLAACETAAGPARFAEGMSGLPRSFLNAGAHGIVATLWPVEDVYESQFTLDFYRRFIVSHDAEAALAETQREWLKPRAGERPADQQQRLATAWAHVFHARPGIQGRK